MLRSALLLALLVLAACDSSSDPDPVVFGGVEVVPRGDASRTVAGGALGGSGRGRPREGGVTVDRPLQRLDVDTDAVTLAAGGRFGVTVDDAAGQPIASIYSEAGSVPDRATLRFAFPDGVLAARITYRLAGVVVFEIPAIDLAPSGGRLARQGSAGEADGKAGSVHVIRNANGQYIMVSDADDAAKRGAGPGDCLGFSIVPPAGTFPDGRLCADWVEVEPLPNAGTPPAAASVSVVGRGVGTFTVRSLVATF